MAEVIGIVSGVVGIAGVTFQFAEGIRKLHAFCKDMQQAPEELCHATHELQLLSPILDSITFTMQKNPAAIVHQAYLPAVLQACREEQCETLKLLDDLQTQVSGKCGALKATLKQNDIRRSLKRMERTKSSLLSAQAIFLDGYMQQGFEDINERLKQQGFDDVIERLKQLESTRITHSRHITHMNQICAAAQVEHVNVSDKQHEDDNEGIFNQPIFQRKRDLVTYYTCFRLQPLPWLSSYTCRIAVERSICGWNINIRVHRTLPLDSPFFRACGSADLGQIQAMIGAKAASVFDRDELGNTALHRLVDCHNGYHVQRFIAVAKFLISQGADVRAKNNLHHPAVLCFDPPPPASLDEASAYIELRKLLTYSVDLDLEEITEQDTIGTLSSLHCSPSDIGLIQKTLLPSWTRIPPMDRIQLLLASKSDLALGAAPAFRAWIIDDLANLSWSEATFHLRAKLTLSILVNVCFWGHRLGSYCQQWREVLRDIALCNDNTCLDIWYAPKDIRGIDIEGNKCSNSIWRSISLKRTPMFEMLGCYCWRSPNEYNRINKALQIAVGELQLLGIDLLLFGRKESKLWDFCSEENFHGSGWNKLRSGESQQSPNWYITGFTYGPDRADWHAFLWTPVDEWAAEFWSMVEDRPLAVPGAYPTDD